MSKADIIRKLGSIEAGALMLLNEATILREELQRLEGGNSPATRKGKVDQALMDRILAKAKKTRLKRSLQHS